MPRGKRKLTHEEYVKQVKDKNSKVEVLGTYLGNSIKILHKCKTCNHTWGVRPNSIKNGQGCPKCAGGVRLTQEEYVSQIVAKGINVEVLGEYVNSDTKIAHRCKKCTHIWDITPSDIKYGRGCPKCAGKRT
ncbi:hypothetical protein [Listeria phage LP-KV022]|uniref:Treble clef zinc finger domain-containing protein n=5 Tax=Homburgvirus TaxID=1921125 RepID=A0A6C0R203_9CAUD|nr:HNH endonuclease [Listeria phage P70]YP_008240410.1 HNH endonuclease [Listeria phage LP-110]YP_008240551.1 HNH endonuclease [Listeria phage LP-037]AWY07739.1 hypothetical protein [Listeria phage LP-KV022]QHZ59434.1 hypothetical protein FK483_0091 [Listeria phage LP-018]AFQ96293.1 hypothetical protein P70_00104 [Listeria phage P70]AGI11549.1 hypothetical protein LP110_046 [Listeria phage LP-110]AGI11688.1 hypothetical protein LP037_073 [Listeria phage LP-037]